MASHILSLAPELISAVCDALNLDDIKHLRLSCKQLGEFLEQSILCTISFNINATNISSSISKLRILGRGRSPGASRATTKLVLRCLAPTYNPSHGSEGSYIGGEWVENPRSPDSPEVVIAEEKMKKYLLLALTSLNNVRSVSWTVHRQDGEWAQNTVVKALRSFSNLQCLSIQIDHIKIAVPLQHLHHLKDITITETRKSSGEGLSYETYLNMGRMIARTPELMAICVKRGGFGSSDAHTSASLHQLFSCFPDDSPRLRLRRITMEKMFLKLDDITLPHFRHLVSLDLCNIHEPYDPGDPFDSDGDEIPPIDSNLLAAHRAVGSTIDEIWIALIKLGPRLEEIRINKVTPSFLKYIETYSGLNKLHIVVNQFKDAIDSDKCAAQFFGLSLAMHASSLQEMNIRPAYEGLWGYGDHSTSVLSSCTEMKSLAISISPGPVEGTLEVNSDPEENKVFSLIDNVSRYLPRLQTLTLYTADSETSRGAWCGTGLEERLYWVASQMADHLRIYSAPPSCRHLPTVSIEVGNQTFENFFPERVAIDWTTGEGGEWHYRNGHVAPSSEGH